MPISTPLKLLQLLEGWIPINVTIGIEPLHHCDQANLGVKHLENMFTKLKHAELRATWGVRGGTEVWISRPIHHPQRTCLVEKATTAAAAGAPWALWESGSPGSHPDDVRRFMFYGRWTIFLSIFVEFCGYSMIVVGLLRMWSLIEKWRDVRIGQKVWNSTESVLKYNRVRYFFVNTCKTICSTFNGI